MEAMIRFHMAGSLDRIEEERCANAVSVAVMIRTRAANKDHRCDGLAFRALPHAMTVACTAASELHAREATHR
jgi:hypothetical protein